MPSVIMTLDDIVFVLTRYFLQKQISENIAMRR